MREAGLEPNRMSEAYDTELLLEKLISLTRRLGRVPTQGDMLLATRQDVDFPSEKVFRRLGNKQQRASLVIDFCETNSGDAEVAELWRRVAPSPQNDDGILTQEQVSSVGYVYLLKHGSRREYKIGRTNNPIRREGEIGVQLPQQLTPVHYIKTDDPIGIESYWHSRFAAKRMGGEWFALTHADVIAFRRWRRIF